MRVIHCVVIRKKPASKRPRIQSSEDSDQPGHPPSLIRVFAVRMKKGWNLSYPLNAQRRLFGLAKTSVKP